MWFHLSGESQVSVRVPLSQVGFSQLIVAFILFVFFPFHENPGPYNILVAVGSGILNILANVLILNALRKVKYHESFLSLAAVLSLSLYYLFPC